MMIKTNIPSLNANRNLNEVSNKQVKSSQRLSSGLRINNAADDSAGLAISEKMRAQIRGLDQAERNIQDGTSLLNVADGALQEAQNIVHRIRELAVQSCNDTNTASDRIKLNEEYINLCNKLDNIAQNTEFNTRKLFTGDYAQRIFNELDILWGNVVETDPPNLATSSPPTMTPSTAPPGASTVINTPVNASMPPLPNETETPKATVNVPLRPPRYYVGHVDYLSGDQEFNSGTPTTENIGGKIVANSGTTTLDVGDNTSYKRNIDGSWNDWQWQRRDWVWIPPQYDSNNQLIPGTGVNGWSAWYNYEVERVSTIEDHSEYGLDGGIAGAPPPRTNTSTTQYQLFPPNTPINSHQPTTKNSTGNTPWDYEHDEWERAEIYSMATITTVQNNNGGAVYVRNSAANSQTYVGNNSANMNYNLGSASPPDYPQARVDTDTHSVTVVTNSTYATVVSRDQTGGSIFNSTTNYGTIYARAENTTVTTNRSALYVDSNGTVASTVDVTTNSGTVYANSHAAQIGSNSGVIAHLNSNSGSSFNLTGTNSGTVRTDAEKVTINSNTGYLLTTRATAELNVTTNTGRIATNANDVKITTNGGQLLLENPTAAVNIANTTSGSRIHTHAQQLTINGTANGSIRVESGANVTINGNNNATVSILGGGALTVNGDLGGTMTVESGATLNINGDITGTLYIKAGANVSFTGQLTGKVVFLDDPSSFSPQPLNVAAGGVVELQNTTTIHIGQNEGTVKMFNSTANIADNKETLQVNSSSNATVSANSGTILNLGDIVPTGSANTGTINNWGQINPPFINGGGSINHYVPFATTNGTYGVSGINFPTVVNGELVPSVQTSVLKLLHSGQEYTLTAEWKPTKNPGDFDILCDCTIGAHDKSGCTDHDLGLVADAFELKFDLDSTVPALQSGEQFVFLPNPVLNAAGMRYDIVGRSIIYNVDVEVTLTENWEDGNGLWIQSGANTKQGHNVYLPNLTRTMSDITINCAICDCGALKSSDLLNVPNATATLGICDMTNSNLSKVRGYIGAELNSLMYAGNSAAISSENLSSAESRIRDADVAKEIMTNAKSNVLSQIGMSLVAQSNQNPQRVLQLLN